MLLFRDANRMAPFSELRREMESVLDRFSPGPYRGILPRPRAFPALNVWEDSEALYAEAEIPGVSMDDLEIYASGNDLTIKGQRKPLIGDGLTYHRQERGAGEFTRVVTLPGEINAEKVEASLKDGVLLIMLPKAEAARRRKIAVKTK